MTSQKLYIDDAAAELNIKLLGRPVIFQSIEILFAERDIEFQAVAERETGHRNIVDPVAVRVGMEPFRKLLDRLLPYLEERSVQHAAAAGFEPRQVAAAILHGIVNHARNAGLFIDPVRRVDSSQNPVGEELAAIDGFPHHPVEPGITHTLLRRPDHTPGHVIRNAVNRSFEEVDPFPVLLHPVAGVGQRIDARLRFAVERREFSGRSVRYSCNQHDDSRQNGEMFHFPLLQFADQSRVLLFAAISFSGRALPSTQTTLKYPKWRGANHGVAA